MATPTQDVVALWYHYEEIAMHFNGLIMQFRLQVMAGAGALGALAGYLVGEKTKDPQQQDWLRALMSSGLWLLILAAAILDSFYYRRLLQGAVNAILAFEKEHPEINMSTTIESTVGSGRDAVWWAYGLLLSVLAAFCIYAWGRYYVRYTKAQP